MVPAGQHTPLLVPVVHMLQLDAQHCRLYRIQTAVRPNLLVVVALPAAMVAQASNMLRQFLVAGGDASAIAIGAQILRGIEAESRTFAQPAGLLVAPLRAEGLCRVFDDLNPVLKCDPAKLVHVGALPI